MKNCTQILLAIHQPADKTFVAAKSKRVFKHLQHLLLGFIFFLSVVVPSEKISAQLAVYNFTGLGTCPNQNPAVTTQPANAVFSTISSVNTTCWAHTNAYDNYNWNNEYTIDPTEYNEFTITSSNGYNLNLTSISFNHYTDYDKSGNKWFLSSSIDNYTSLLDSGVILLTSQNVNINLPAASFSNLGTVTFRFYIIRMKNLASWIMDDLAVNGTTVIAPFNPPNPTSNSPQCSSPGVTISASGTPPPGITWYWQTSPAGTSTTNAGATYIVSSSGTYYLRAQDNTTLAWSSGAGSISVVVSSNVAAPIFDLGASSSRCPGALTISYSATAANSTGITYSLDASSLGGGNTINPATGDVSFSAGWNAASTITATASGCNGPVSSTHTVSIAPPAGTPVFSAGISSNRCKGTAIVSYAATASNSTAITYSLDAVSLGAGLTINSTTGVVSYTNSWVGQSTITASAAGCSGPVTATHTATSYDGVQDPVFSLGSNSTRCQGAATVNYTATASNAWGGITYTLDASSLAGGNTIDANTGMVTFAVGWSGNSTVIASAAGCGGPKTMNHSITTTPSVGAPVFDLGTTSTRCQKAEQVDYKSNASNTTGIVYTLDATSLAAGNTFTYTGSEGKVTFTAGWTGTSVVTATAAGCNGPVSSTHTITTVPTVSAPIFAAGASSLRCAGPGTQSYSATAANSTAITYSLDGISTAFGNTINSSTGTVTFMPLWVGTSVITATATGCNGPATATHTVTISNAVTTPVFGLGSSSSRCQAAGTVTYTATANYTSGITYSLDATSATAGNTINSSNGAVTYVAGWSGTTIITASAAGCGGPKTANHTVTVNPPVAVPVFSSGTSSVRCQGAGSVPYAATASGSTSINYTLDATSSSAGNTINAITGTVAFTAGWSGTSTITATAAGCTGPKSAVHTVTITPTVGVPVFTGGATSGRCQGAGNVTYPATATNSTGITYSLDATSLSAGNTINNTTSEVIFVAGWSGTTTITASAAGCNGPKTATHTVTVNPTVANPVFALGLQSLRNQGAGTVTYTATATGSTGITYSLDASSLAGGNSINPATGTVTWTAGWFGSSAVTATATGCNGPSTATHIININPSVVQTPLYLSSPGQVLTRIDPVATGNVTTVQTAELSSNGTNSTQFSLSPVLCSPLTIKAQNISVLLYLTITSGSMPVNPSITAQLKYGSTNIITLTNPVYNSGTGVITWTGILGSDITVPTGQPVELVITTVQNGTKFKIDYNSMTKPSRISLLPVSTFIDFVSFDVYNAPYPGGSIRTTGSANTTYYARATVTTPFGYRDITGMDILINPPGTTVPVVCVDSTTCNRIYEYPWTTSTTTGSYNLLATAKEGYENLIKNSDLLTFTVCVVCGPVAMPDSAIGAGGSPVIVDVLANDYDPNNNIKISTLSIPVQANNGTGYVANNKIVYLPNGTFAGRDTLTYQICDSTNICTTGQAYFTINPLLVDPCAEATKTHIYYLPFSENEARIALDSSTNNAFPSNNIRTIISLKMPYPGMTIIWDHWEDGYEVNTLNPLQTTTQIWGDGNPYNGIAPGYANDIIPAGGGIVLDNTIPTNPRVPANIFYDGRDKITSSGQITVTQVCGEPSIMSVQCMKTNVSPVKDYGTSFTIPVGQNYNSQDFRYTSLFIRASKNNTVIDIDKDNNGTLETTATLNEGEVLLVNGSVLSGASIAATENIGVDLHFGGNDGYSSRDVPIFPATWYSDIYYSPVPTTGRTSTTPRDTAVVMLYNNLNRSININWSSGIPSNGTLTLPAKTVVRFPLAYSQTAAYKFVNPTGESFTAIQICDSYTPGGGGNGGAEFDWSFNLIAQRRLTDFGTIAWAPGSINGTRNDNPVWVTPTNNTTIYVKYNGDLSGSSGLLSPCGMRYDVSYTLNALNHKRLLDPNDNDQGGLAVYTCDGTKLAAVYGEDPSTAVTASPSWDVGSTIQPFCKQKLIFANDDYARTIINQPVTISVLTNDGGFLSVIDPASVTNTALLQPQNGTVFINANGTIIYTPNPGFVGKDTFEYNVCSTPTPIVCDKATVFVDISLCPAPSYENIVAGMVFLDKNNDGINNDGRTGLAGAKVLLYVDGNCNSTIDANELKDSITVDVSGTYQFITYPERIVADNFDGPGGVRTCANGTDGNADWVGNWSDLGDPSTGFCNTSQTQANTHCEIYKDGSFSNALRLKNRNVSATRTVNLTGASYAFLTFSYRRKSATLAASEDIIVQASSNGTTFGTVYTIAGDGTTDASYVTVYNQNITAYAAPVTHIRFLTNNNMDDNDTVYIDDVNVQFLRYPQCYITKLDPASVPVTYHTTTPTLHAVTATSNATCLAPYDFGIAKDKITITGSLFNDANGLTDNVVNGTATGLVAGAPVYVYLIDGTGLVVNRATLIPASGAFTLTNVDVQANYTLQLSTLSVNVGDVPPASMFLPANWVNTGEAFGNNNNAGSGNEPGTPDGAIAVTTTLSNVANVNFGIEQLPESYNHTTSISPPVLNQMITLNGGSNPPILTGSDPEDNPATTVLTNKSVIIDNVPANAELYYNNILVVNGQLISNFNPSLFKVKITTINPGTNSIVFNYSYVDLAIRKDPTPAVYTLTWSSNLTITGTLFNDANALTDNLINGNAIGLVAGSAMYAYLVDGTGLVVNKSTLVPGTGVFTFSSVNINSNYTLKLSTQSVAIGAVPPASLLLPANWVATGDAFGTNNGAGSGNETGTPDGAIVITTAYTNVTNVNFGIEQLPESYDHSTAIPQPVLNQFITLNGGTNPPILTGSDPEDNPVTTVLTNKAVIIDNVPVNQELYYNNILVTNGQLINNFNPSLLQVKITNITPGSNTVVFNYSYVDLANKKDPTPAIYTLTWNSVITVSGTLFNDANGLTDNLVNGTGIGELTNSTMYAYLVDGGDKVVSKSTLIPATGAFAFANVNMMSNYTLKLSTLNVNVGTIAPAGSLLPSNWVATGEAFGNNNTAGSGNETGQPNSTIGITTGVVNITNVNFGVERLPESYNHTTSIAQPTINQLITLDGGSNPPILTGSDPEDNPVTAVLTNKSLIIDNVPGNAELYYNNVLVTNGRLINNFNPTLFKAKITSISPGTNTIVFNYSYVDLANMKDPTPATYTLLWNSTLSAEALVAVVNLNGSVATVNWSTLSEQNTNYFVVERSLDNINYTVIGNRVTAAGTSTTKREYQQPDNISSLTQKAIIYYRVKLIDIDGKFKYSNVVALRLSQKPGVTIWPNPFETNITVSITTEKETTVEINLIDVSGKTVKANTQSVAKGITRITIDGLERLPAGIYLVEIVDQKAGTTYQKLLKNNR